ncbi:MAG: NAD+ synthase [Methanobacteriota archaeon]|jgi:NAD+ synthetase|nr:MAG: NAD+ synthase [Euryarchaeota archaeon]HIG19681.1 NAD+ synthase [Candidatus Poseidoniales archaeon]
MGLVVALLQLNPTVGDLAGNAAEVERAVALAAANGADLAITSELVISGYPPRDLLRDPEFIQQCADVTAAIETPIPLIVGTPLPPTSDRHLPGNGSMRIVPGRKAKVATRKQLLPTYDVFDELRYFEPDKAPGILRLSENLSIGVTICEDAWQHAGEVPADYDADPIEQLAAWQHQGEPLALSVNLSSSPYHLHKEGTRGDVVRAAAKTLGHPYLLCNQIGGNDDLLFDGRSLAAWPDGRMIQAPSWCAGVLLVDIEDGDGDAARWLPWPDGKCCTECNCKVECVGVGSEPSVPESGVDLLAAITTGLGDYCRKSGIKKLVLGMSGGLDSSVCAAIAVRAVGAKNVLGLSMPSRYSSDHSIADAEATAKALGMELHTHSITALHQAAEAELNDELVDGNPVARENIQSRLRGMMVMAAANSRGAMAVTTGNKSELAMGYCTLYGDMVGGYAPIGDLYKSEVYDVARALNREAERFGETPPITESTLTKPPSAELAPDQTDQDTLPPYETLDAILHAHIENGASKSTLIASDFDETLVNWILERLNANEHKRWQMAPAPRVSNRAFGQGWRQPLAAKK